MRDHDPAAVKADLLPKLRHMASCAPIESRSALDAIYVPEASWLGCHPFNQLHGVLQIEDVVYGPLRRALRGMRRRDDIFMAGHWKDADWLCATGYLHGMMVGDWLGVPATENWVYLRYGEFHRIERGRVAASFTIFDLPDLMRQAGVPPWRPGLGVETLMPGPATGDGVSLAAGDPEATRRSLKLVEDMIVGLHQYDRVSSASMGMERFWTPEMMWYGPGMIGASQGLDGFLRFHQEPWQEGIPDYQGGNHVARFADGDFVASTGWPSIRATHDQTFFDLPATGKRIEIRVMDWWHRSDDKLDENWIFIDLPHMFLQLGVDLFERMGHATLWRLAEQERIAKRRRTS